MTTRITTIMQLPAELVTEILSRAPINELGRCKCVCKSWRSLIGSPQFRQIYRIRDRGLILYWSKTDRILPKTGRITSELRFLYSLPNPNPKPPEEKFRPLRELNVGSDTGECRIVNGLIASCVRESPSDLLSIYSVCRGEKMMVPEPLPYHSSYSSYHLRFDPVSRRYKILRLIFVRNKELKMELQGIHIITLQPSSLPSEWRKLDFDSVGILNLPGIFLQFLYSSVSFPSNTVCSGDGVVCWVLSELGGVALFDVHQERFRWVKFPADLEVILKELHPRKAPNQILVPRSQFKEQRLSLSLWVLAEKEGDGPECFTLEDDEGEKWSRQFLSFPQESVAMSNSDSHWVGKIPKEFLHSDVHQYCIHRDMRPHLCRRLSFLPNSYDHFYFSLDDLLSGQL